MEQPSFFVYVFQRRVRAIPLTQIAEITLYVESIDNDLPLNKGSGEYLARLASTHPLSQQQIHGGPPIILRGSIVHASELINQLRRSI